MFEWLSIKIKHRIFVKKWRERNVHNTTYPVNDFDIEKVFVGNYSYGGLYVGNDDSKSILQVGNFVSIGSNVKFLVGYDHPMNLISTFPFKVKVLKMQPTEASGKGSIIVGDDVWLGDNSVVLSGVTIGQGAVVAAGVIITKDVPPYAIVGGGPAKIIKYRFDEKMISDLLKVDYGKLTQKQIEKHLEDLYVPLVDKEQLQWLLSE